MKHTIPGSSRRALLGTGFALLTCISAANADTVYSSAGFELPNFVPMLALEGQHGWQKDAGASTATISTNSAQNSLQSLQILKAANATGDTRWNIATPFSPSAALNAVSIDVEMRVNISAIDYGPAFGFEARDGSKLVGAFAVDAGTGRVLYVESGTGRLLSTAKTVSRGVYHHYQLTTDFANKRYLVAVDGTVVRTEPFINSAATGLSATSIATYALDAATIGSSNGVAYVENLEITSKKVAVVTPDPTPPAAPANLMAVGGKSKITLSWSTVSGAAGYKLYRDTTSNGQAATPLATGLTTPGYTDGNLPDGATYYYKVTAVNAAGESAKSNEASATTAAPDLGIANLTVSDSTPGVGDSVVLRATVTNNSGSTSAENQSVTFSDGESVIGTASVAALAAGASTAVQVTWTPQTAGPRTLAAQVSGLEGESDLANNRTTRELTVYNYYTYNANGTLVATGTPNSSTQNKWYKYNIGIPMSMIKEVRVVGQVSTYDDSASAAIGQPSPYLESYTGDGKLDLSFIGAVTPTGPGNWAMSSQSPAVTGTIRPMGDNYVDLKVSGLNATESAKDQVKVYGVVIQIKYLAP